MNEMTGVLPCTTATAAVEAQLTSYFTDVLNQDPAVIAECLSAPTMAGLTVKLEATLGVAKNWDGNDEDFKAIDWDWLTYDLVAEDITDEFLQTNLEGMEELQAIIDILLTDIKLIDVLQTALGKSLVDATTTTVATTTAGMDAATTTANGIAADASGVTTTVAAAAGDTTTAAAAVTTTANAIAADANDVTTTAAAAATTTANAIIADVSDVTTAANAYAPGQGKIKLNTHQTDLTFVKGWLLEIHTSRSKYPGKKPFALKLVTIPAQSLISCLIPSVALKSTVN